VAVFVAHSDESEVHQPRGEFFLGGYVAREDEWPFVTDAWQERVLDGPPKIPYLHMREIRTAAWRDRYHISFNDAEERVADAGRVINSFGNIAVMASTIQRSELKDIFHKGYKKLKNVPRGIDEPDYLCFIGYAASMIAQVRKKWPEATRVNFVVSRKKGVTHHIQTFRDELKRFIKPPLQDLVGDLLPASMENVIPLQAADALLWHIQRYCACGRDQGKMDASDGIHLAYFIQNGELDGTIHAWDRGDLEKMAEDWANAGRIPG
jgi:hypothetical protein